MNYSRPTTDRPPLILATLVVYVTLLAAGVQPAAASNNVQSYMDPEPQSQPQARPLSAGVVRTGPLQGGIKSETSINPSLRVTPVYGGRVGAQGGYLKPLRPTEDGIEPVQYKGGVRVGGPLDADIESGGPTMYSGSNNHGRHIQGVIAPISSYRKTPANGVIDYGPATGYLPSTNSLQTLEAAPPHYQTVGRGVTVLSKELVVEHMPVVMPFGPGNVPFVQMIRPSMSSTIGYLFSPGSDGQTSNSVATSSDSHYITRGGVTSLPGYEVTISPPGLEKQTLGGVWSANYPAPANAPKSLMANAGLLSPQRLFTRAEPVTDMARANLLPQFSSGNNKCTNWGDWYRTVADAIYSRWQNLDVCPGTSKLEVTVKADHEISARVVEFVPAADIDRNVPRETEFRETSVRIVNNIGFFEIPDFPTPQTEQVVFNIDLKRTVDGPTGVSIAGFPKK
jgi:hypothetical protein